MTKIQEGYYRYERASSHIQHANNVYNNAYTLLKSQQDSYELPIDGWYFFSTPEAACEFFEVDISEHDYLTYDPDEQHPDEGIDPDVV